MKARIVAAWKVLRGEWVASPPAPKTTFTCGWGTDTTTVYTSSPITFTGGWWHS